MYRKNLENETTGEVSYGQKTYSYTFCKYFRKNLLTFNKVSLISLRSTEKLSLERSLYRYFLHNDHSHYAQ